MKLKIKPSARIKHRYALIEAKSKEDIEKSILDYIGILGWAKASPVFVNVKKETDGNRFILAFNRTEINNVLASFEVSSQNIRVLRVSGTIKGLKK